MPLLTKSRNTTTVKDAHENPIRRKTSNEASSEKLCPKKTGNFLLGVGLFFAVIFFLGIALHIRSVDDPMITCLRYIGVSLGFAFWYFFCKEIKKGS